MKKFYLLLAVIAPFLFFSCNQTGNDSKTNLSVDSLVNLVDSQKKQIKSLNDTIEMLRFPADQRLAKAIESLQSGNLDEAESLLNQIKQIFPNSQEAKACDEQLQIVADQRQKIIAEQERIKALGFKALTPVTNAKIGDVNISISNISIGKDFVHDTYSTYGSSSWYYNTADKGHKYITCAMSVTSDNTNPDIPTLALYTINGDKLNYEGTFKIEFARWDDYGTYLGNEHDMNNDFAKVNTVKFKLGCEAKEEVFSKPYMVVLKMENTQSRDEDRYSNPPVRYEGNANYPSTLTIDDFNNSYKAIKIANL